MRQLSVNPTRQDCRICSSCQISYDESEWKPRHTSHVYPRTGDIACAIHPAAGASLFKPTEQWNALVNGQLDISSFPLDYASGKVRAFGATLMPGLVRSHERAARMSDSKFMKDIKARIEQAETRTEQAEAALQQVVQNKDIDLHPET